MTEIVTQYRAPKRVKSRMATDDVVTASSLATHLGMTRQNVARLTAEAVIEQRSDGCYDQTASRWRELVRRDAVDALIDQIAGTVLRRIMF
jgi:hypothetical protein